MFARAQEYVEEMGGVLSYRPPLDAEHVWVLCEKGHEWSAFIKNMAARRSWCPECYGNKPHSIEDMRRLAARRGGECLSREYFGLKTKLEWKCKQGHTWEAIPNNIKNHGCWCPRCHVNIGEEIVRATLEEAFPGKTFDRTRSLPWLQGLELDGYNDEMKLAFEYQGIQHYERVPHFQRDEGAFDSQVARDALTEERCVNEEVTLLTVSYQIGFENLRNWVRKELSLLGYELSPEIGTNEEFNDRVRIHGTSNERHYSRIVEVIRRKGGECLSEKYLGYRIKLRIRCGAGHVFSSTPESIDQPEHRGVRFCPDCGGTKKKDDDEVRSLVESCGFELLNIESRNASGRSRRYITVKCQQGHVYDVLYDNFNPKDGKPKKGCKDCHHAKVGGIKRGNPSQWCLKNGIALLDEYKNQSERHRWQCLEGHTFTASFSSLQQRGSRACVQCDLLAFASKNRLTLLTPWSDGHGPTATLEWKCIICEAAISFTKASIGRKKEFCPNCK
jgi:hypothetical protein